MVSHSTMSRPQPPTHKPNERLRGTAGPAKSSDVEMATVPATTNIRFIRPSKAYAPIRAGDTRVLSHASTTKLIESNCRQFFLGTNAVNSPGRCPACLIACPQERGAGRWGYNIHRVLRRNEATAGPFAEQRRFPQRGFSRARRVRMSAEVRREL
jgi:hypothetical protein